jgi:gamma-glutamyltranspeptidase / glutathione hydrolase
MRLTQNWEIRKPGATSPRGLVAAQNAVAARVGADILKAGGSAADAAVAAALALAAVEPWNSGLGAIGFSVVHPAGADHAEAIDFGPVAPAGLDPAAYPLTGASRTELFTWPQVAGDRNVHGPLSFAVPSAVAGYAAANERFGRLPWRELAAPAAALARDGLPVDWWTTLKITGEAATLRRYDESRRVYLPEGLPPFLPAGRDSLTLPLGRLADTLARLAEAGPDDLYKGDIARMIAADAQAAGAALSAADLANCRARIGPTRDIDYRGIRFQVAAGLNAGPTLARVLASLSARRLAAAPDAAYFTALAEALWQAYGERLETLGDTESGRETSTTHITAADRDGTIVALTTTLLSSFGSRHVLPATGILMNNGIMWFDPRPGRANSIGPGKRALSNMCPLVVARDGRPWFGVGASGGRHILAAVTQMANFVVDFGMEPEEAGHQPRVDVGGPDGIAIDRRLPPAIRDKLLKLPGAKLVEHTIWPSRFACPNLVLRGDDGRTRGISDAHSPWSAAIAEPE